MSTESKRPDAVDGHHMDGHHTDGHYTDGHQPDGHHTENALLAISNAMVHIYKQQFGRGPTKARTQWCGPDLITVTLEDTFTPAERNLVKKDEHQRVRDLRMYFQYASVPEFCGPIEEITGRKVRAFVSGVDTEADGFSVETFALHEQGYEGPSRIPAATG